jgi:hypothetical protein
MPTPDRFPRPLEEEEIQFEEQSTDPTVNGAIRYVSGDFKAKDSEGVFNLRNADSFLTSRDEGSVLVSRNGNVLITRHNPPPTT